MNPLSNDVAHMSKLLDLCGYPVKALSTWFTSYDEPHKLLHHDEIGWYFFKFEIRYRLLNSAPRIPRSVLKILPDHHGFEAWCADHGIELIPYAPSSLIFWAKPADTAGEMALKMRWG